MTPREALLEACMIDEAVDRLKAVHAWVNTWCVILEGEFDITEPVYFALDAGGRAHFAAVRNAHTLHSLVQLLLREGVANGVLQVQEINPRPGAVTLRTRIQLVKAR